MRALLLLACAAVVAAGDAKAPIAWGAWAPLTPGGKPLAVSYYNLLAGAGGGVELWCDANVNGTDMVIGLPGPDLAGLQRTLPRFGADIVRGYDADLLGRKTPIISRSAATRLKDGRHVVIAAIGPEYGAGGKLTELYPAVFVSPDGTTGSWKHLGTLAGEPERELVTARKGKQAFRFEGGSLFERPDGTLALYCGWNPGQPGGSRLALLTAPAAEGPWTFHRTGRAITDLTARLPASGWLFPAVYDLGPRGLLLAGGEKWPPTRIDAAISRDGLAFTPIAPLLTDAGTILAGSTSLKSIRLLYQPGTDDVLAVANPHRKGGGDAMYPLYWTIGTFTTPKPATAAKGR
ncbi:MAG: hypothetical protein RLZZ127_984 [Planctomycetota bacterium]|jgi:hypothetical protein